MSRSFWDNLPAIIVALGSFVMGILTWWRAGYAITLVKQVAVQTDGLTKALVKSEKTVSRAEGKEEGKAEEKAANGRSQKP